MSSPGSDTYRAADYLLGLLTLLLAGMLVLWTARYLQAVRLPPASPGSYHFIATTEDVSSGALAFELEGRPWLLARKGMQFSAVSAYCTFRGSKIEWDPAMAVFLCRGHGGVFAHDGTNISGLAASPLERLRIRVVGDRIYGARVRT